MISSDYQGETSAKSHFVVLSEAKDLVFSCSYEILRSLRALRMTSEGTFAEVSIWKGLASELSQVYLERESILPAKMVSSLTFSSASAPWPPATTPGRIG